MIRTTCSLVLLAAVSTAQTGISSSENYSMVVRANPTGSGTAAGGNFQGMMDVGLPAVGQTDLFVHPYAVTAGVLAFDGILSLSEPLIVWVSPNGGGKDGGDAVSLHGANLVDGLGGASVQFGGTSVTPSGGGETKLDVLTPPGVNAWGNPLAEVDVTVSHTGGADTVDDGYLYKPALLAPEPAVVGKLLTLEWHGEPGELYSIAFGGSLGIGVPVAPLEGAAEILTTIVILTDFAASVTGEESHDFPLPNDPLLVGTLLEFQAATLTSLAPLAGTFTNLVGVTVAAD